MSQDAAPEKLITKVELQKKNKHRYNIYIEEEYAFSVHEDILIKHRLMKGEAVDSAKLHQVLRDEECNEAYSKAARLLGLRPRSFHELKQRMLQDGYELNIVEDTLQRLSEQGYIDDLEFAKQWTEHRVHFQKKGKSFIRQELLQKGVGREHIHEALQHIDPEDELNSAVQIGAKKWRQTSGDTFERKRKTASFLMRRGFSAAVVQQALRKINEVNK